MQQRLEQQKKQIEEKMGSQLFQKVHKILLMHKQRDSEGSKVAEDLKPVTKQSRELKDLCFALEQIVFMMD